MSFIAFTFHNSILEEAMDIANINNREAFFLDTNIVKKDDEATLFHVESVPFGWDMFYKMIISLVQCNPDKGHILEIDGETIYQFGEYNHFNTKPVLKIGWDD